MTTQTTATLVDLQAWRRWRSGHRGQRHWDSWADDCPALLGWSTDELMTPTGSRRTDAMQGALVGLAQSGEGDAATTLLVQLRPGLIRLIRWAAANGMWSWYESTEEVRAVFYETLYRHSLERRPDKIAANLVLDTRQRLSRSHHRLERVRTAEFRPGRDPSDGGTVLPGRSAALTSVGHDTAETLSVRSALSAAVERLPGSDSSRRLTATVAFRAWILDEPRSTIAADLGMANEAVAMRLHRLRSALKHQDLR